MQTFAGTVDVDCEALKPALASALAVISECVMVSVLVDPGVDKPNKKKILETANKKLLEQEKNLGLNIQGLLHKTVVAEAARLMYDST